LVHASVEIVLVFCMFSLRRDTKALD